MREIEQPLCEDTSPLTGSKCRNLASIMIDRASEQFFLCGQCALRRYLHAPGRPRSEAAE